MTKPVITKRATKGSALTYDELDANFQNLDDATISLKAGSAGTTVTSDLNGTITLVAGTGITLSGNNTSKEVTINSTGSSKEYTVDPTTITISSAGSYYYTYAGYDVLNIIVSGAAWGNAFFYVQSPPTNKKFKIIVNKSGSGTSLNITSGVSATIYGDIGSTTPIDEAGRYIFDIDYFTSYAYIKSTSQSMYRSLVSNNINITSNANSPSLDAFSNATSYANGATVDFANFSGMILINRQDGGSGNVALWLCGSGATVKLGDSIGNQSGTIAVYGPISGYRWTNNTGGTITASFFSIRTRQGA